MIDISETTYFESDCVGSFWQDENGSALVREKEHTLIITDIIVVSDIAKLFFAENFALLRKLHKESNSPYTCSVLLIDFTARKRALSLETFSLRHITRVTFFFVR